MMLYKDCKRQHAAGASRARQARMIWYHVEYKNKV